MFNSQVRAPSEGPKRVTSWRNAEGALRYPNSDFEREVENENCALRALCLSIIIK
jgi:hypothetical protein